MSDDAASPSGDGGQLREEAAAWFARMRGEEAEHHRPAFEAWLARGALHRAAYNRIGEVFAAAKILKDGNQSSDEQSGLNGVARRSALLALAAAAIVSSLLLVILVPRGGSDQEARGSPTQAAGVPHRSGLTHVETLRLAGATITLDRDSLFVTRIDDKPDVSRLERGRARVVVRGRAPQTILAGPGEAVSSNGTFDLWLRSDGSLDAQVFAGRVGLRPAVFGGNDGALRATVYLVEGQRYRLTRVGIGTRFADATTRGWPLGILEFRQTPLGDVIEEANRYASSKIVLADPALANRRISGRFRIDHPLQLAGRLAEALSLQVDLTSPGMITLRALPKKSASGA